MRLPALLSCPANLSLEKRRKRGIARGGIERGKGMTEATKRDRGLLRIDGDECKGCGLCMQACPPKVIRFSEELNHYGYRTARVYGRRLYGLRHLFPGLPGAGRDHRAAACGSSRGAGRWREQRDAQTTDERQRSHRQERNPGGLPGVLWISHHPGQRDHGGGCALYAESWAACLCRRRAKWRPSTCSTARRLRACAP